MKAKYRNWMKKYASPGGCLAGLCSEYTILMHATYPELKMIDGEYHQPSEVLNESHCWLLDPDDEIIDPTASQFENGGVYVDNTPWFPTISRELFNLAVKAAEIICGEKLLPDNTWVAWQVRELLEHYEEEIEYRDQEKQHRPKKKKKRAA